MLNGKERGGQDAPHFRDLDFEYEGDVPSHGAHASTIT